MAHVARVGMPKNAGPRFPTRAEGKPHTFLWKLPEPTICNQGFVEGQVHVPPSHVAIIKLKVPGGVVPQWHIKIKCVPVQPAFDQKHLAFLFPHSLFTLSFVTACEDEVDYSICCSASADGGRFGRE